MFRKRMVECKHLAGVYLRSTNRYHARVLSAVVTASSSVEFQQSVIAQHVFEQFQVSFC